MRNRGKSNLKRQRSSRKPKRKFYLVCEGKNTEPTYFKALKNVLKSSLIEVITQEGVGVPKTIAAKAEELACVEKLAKWKRRNKDSFAKDDEVWAVFDRDNHPNYAKAKSQCDKAQIGVAYSEVVPVF